MRIFPTAGFTAYVFQPFAWKARKDTVIDRKSEYTDNADRVEVERSFSFAKRCCGLARIVKKLDTTTRSSIELSILVMNVARIAARSLRRLFVVLLSKFFGQDFLLIYESKCHVDLLVA